MQPLIVANEVRRSVRRQLIVDANAQFGYACALLIDESAFAKKGDMSAGVARQWNGRLGKTDNSQVGVFAAVVRDRVAALVEGELYVPEEWFADATRYQDVGIPEGMEFFPAGTFPALKKVGAGGTAARLRDAVLAGVRPIENGDRSRRGYRGRASVTLCDGG